MNSRSARAQRGAVLVVGLILLVMITLMTVTAQNVSTINLKTVGNMQFRDESIAAANRAIAQVLSSPFTGAPVAQAINVDIDNDDDTDYVVSVARPVCLSSTQTTNPAPTSVSLGSALSSQSMWTTTWDLDASVTGSNVGGAVVRVHCGVRVLLSEAEKNAVCP